MELPTGRDSRSRRRAFLPAAGFGLAYGAGIGLASIAGALWLRHGIDPDLGIALGLFTLGAALAGFLTALLMIWAPPRRFAARFAAALVLLLALTTGLDAFFLFVEYAAYYAQWWPPAFSVHWFFTATTTFLGVSFYYVAIGVPMIIPVGLPVALLAALLLARK